MRIAHITATFPPNYTGTGNVAFYNARELSRLGHDVHVFTANYLRAPAGEKLEGIEVHRLKPLVQAGNAPFTPQLPPMLREFDLIHLHFPFVSGAELVRLASRSTHTPLLVSFHNDLVGDGARARLFSVYQRFSAWSTVRHAARLCVVSKDHYHASILKQQLPNNQPLVVEIPNGVDGKEFHPEVSGNIREQYSIPIDTKLVLFVAVLDRAHHFKGLGRLLEAIALLPEDIWLMIAGDGDARDSYERQALGLAGRRYIDAKYDWRNLGSLLETVYTDILASHGPVS